MKLNDNLKQLRLRRMIKFKGTFMAIKMYFAWKRNMKRWGCEPGDLSRRNRNIYR